jgi:hypothetical protein
VLSGNKLVRKKSLKVVFPSQRQTGLSKVKFFTEVKPKKVIGQKKNRNFLSFNSGQDDNFKDESVSKQQTLLRSSNHVFDSRRSSTKSTLKNLLHQKGKKITILKEKSSPQTLNQSSK